MNIKTLKKGEAVPSNMRRLPHPMPQAIARAHTQFQTQIHEHFAEDYVYVYVLKEDYQKDQEQERMMRTDKKIKWIRTKIRKTILLKSKPVEVKVCQPKEIIVKERKTLVGTKKTFLKVDRPMRLHFRPQGENGERPFIIENELEFFIDNDGETTRIMTIEKFEGKRWGQGLASLLSLAQSNYQKAGLKIYNLPGPSHK